MNEQQSPTFSASPPASIVNHTPITFECMWAFNAHVARIKSRTAKNIVWTILWSLLLVVWIVLCFVRPSTAATISLFICILAIAGHVYTIVFLQVILKNQVKKHPHLGGQYAFTFEEDSFIEDFTSASATSQSRTLYSALLRVEETEEYLYLFNQPSSAFLVSKNGFSQGTAEALKALIRSKLPPDKIHFK